MTSSVEKTSPGGREAGEPLEQTATGSRHYRRARRDRGAETRARLIAAALDVFGREGYEGATTRQIAREADANLAAIVYHFGGKEELHNAVAEYIVERTGSLVGPAMAAAAAPEAAATPEAARAMLLTMLATYVDVILGDDEAELWARFIVREQLQPTGAFDVIYGFMGGAHALCARLVATILGRNEEDEAIKLLVFTMMGQILVFRVAQALVLRRMEWSAVGETQRADIKRQVLRQVAAILDSEATP
ncbi:transcriptional regulator, TetR family [Bauldia litoralis]|uniref:Transcriptional regulator, TetR family n=1 Tax=Bauldia litoralis TaxID=665467 RepID=A0A1G6CQG8_9HYPH|nr:transcriptional regulator, TetR family [Bauldia litoralis]